MSQLMNSTEFWKSWMSRSRLLICVVIVVNALVASAQNIDPYDSAFLSSYDQIEEFKSISNLDPNKSAILSAILPGLGQAYNNQYWKIPIVYGVGLVFGHYINYNHQLYHEFRNAVRAQSDNSSETVNYYSDLFSETSLVRNRDKFRRDRDFLIILGSVMYLLNIVDAHVSAHLKEFEINESLSFNIRPSIQSSPVFSQAIGFSVALNIR